MSYYYWLIIFAVASYLIITDSSIAAAFYYVFMLAKTHIHKQIWWILNNPRNPIVKYIVYRRSLKLARELMDELKNK